MNVVCVPSWSNCFRLIQESETSIPNPLVFLKKSWVFALQNSDKLAVFDSARLFCKNTHVFVNPILVRLAKVLLENFCEVEEAILFVDTPFLAHFLRIDQVFP